MVDTWATVGSCAQIGENVHLSGGVGIGGVLEPPQAAPVIVGDEAFIGSRCIVAEGARVGAGAVLGAGAILTGSIPVIDAETGDELSRGIVPAVVRRGRRPPDPGRSPVASSACRASWSSSGSTEGERHDKAQLNDILRDARRRRHGLTALGREPRPAGAHRRRWSTMPSESRDEGRLADCFEASCGRSPGSR